MFRNRIAAGLMAFALSLGAAPVAAGPLEDADAAHRQGDYATSMRLLRPLADQGNATAQTRIGFMYELGQGVLQNYAAAVTWFRKAADQGNADAQDGLGLSYLYGQGVPQDFTEALTWYRKAAGQGHADAQNNLGNMYFNGQGVPQDYLQAHTWFNLAAAGFPASAAKLRDLALKSRDSVAARMTPAQIAEAQKLAREWKPTPPN
jgi:TPR repeat protein